MHRGGVLTGQGLDEWEETRGSDGAGRGWNSRWESNLTQGSATSCQSAEHGQSWVDERVQCCDRRRRSDLPTHQWTRWKELVCQEAGVRNTHRQTGDERLMVTLKESACVRTGGRRKPQDYALSPRVGGRKDFRNLKDGGEL